MGKKGFGHVVRGYVDSVLRHLSLAESPAQFMLKLHMYQLAIGERASKGSDWVKGGKLVNYFTEMLESPDSANWARALIDPPGYLSACSDQCMRAIQQEGTNSPLQQT